MRKIYYYYDPLARQRPIGGVRLQGTATTVPARFVLFDAVGRIGVGRIKSLLPLKLRSEIARNENFVYLCVLCRIYKVRKAKN